MNKKIPKGSCVCDNYCSYSSTLRPNEPISMIMQPFDCVNCYRIRETLINLFFANSNSITHSIIDNYYNNKNNIIFKVKDKDGNDITDSIIEFDRQKCHEAIDKHDINEFFS